ncbi:citrate lyase subunit beta [Salmonella enterica subsp. enterica]|uniref:Citrate lyase subunit beta n=1 Tax=Salmonella enterica I TaxID=59201 RepID=A0A379X075_SALET|nr:citrate lyase subunit beta [Salmonella enterica subsp. enterica]
MVDINNEEGFLKEVQLAKGLGFNGKSLVNPRQIELLHQAYSPTRKEVEHAHEVMLPLKRLSLAVWASFHSTAK